MKEHHVLMLLLLIGSVVALNNRPHTNSPSPAFQKERKTSYWECWIDGTYTQIRVVRGEMFNAHIKSSTHGPLIFHGSQKVDDTERITQLVGTIELEKDKRAIGTFFAEQAVKVGEKETEYSLMGTLNIIQTNSKHTLILTPLP